MTGGDIQFSVLPHMLSVIGCLSDLLFFLSCSNRDFSINVEIQQNMNVINEIKFDSLDDNFFSDLICYYFLDRFHLSKKYSNQQ